MAKKTAKKKTAKSSADVPFEQSLAELEEIVGELEGGELGLADALEKYEHGVSRLRACQQQLEHAERRIELLSGVDADGNPITEPFDDESSVSLDEKGGTGSRRRSTPASRKTAGSKRSRGGGSSVDDSTSLF